MGASFRLPLPRRQALLFLIAMLVPCAVLVTLGLRTMEQDRQLEEGRRDVERQRRVDRTREALLAELERITLQQMTLAVARGGDMAVGPEAPVAFVGALRDEALLLPWERTPASEASREGLEHGAFADRMREAEGLEVGARRHDEAARRYRAAIDDARTPAQQTYARLLLARALRAGRRLEESRAHFERVLAAPVDQVDEFNVPLGLYAAAALERAGARQEALIDRVRTAVNPDRLVSSNALRIARDLAVALGDAGLTSTLAATIEDREQAAALQRDFATVVPAPGPESVWTAYGDPVWLIGVTPPAGSFDGLVVAVRAADVLARLDVPGGEVRLAAPADAAGQTLGEGLRGLRVVLPPEAPAAGSRPLFFAIGILLALTFTLVAGGLLWRDVQRDLRLSAMRSQFVASVSHELRTPLAAIRMFSETLKLDEEVDRRTRSEYLDTILHESERLSRLVDNVLDFGKIERGQKTYRFEPVQLEEVVSKAARTAQYPLERAGFSLNVDVEPGLPPVSADPDALQQAVLNLLSNAMKYSGGSREIDLRLDRQNGHARIQVVDRGVGIAPADQPRVFDRFYRVASDENRHIPGTGLGLTIVAHVAGAHGGGVDIDSRPGIGSAFTMRLPLEDSRRGA